MKTIAIVFTFGISCLYVGGCASNWSQPSKPGTVAARLENAGARYQTTEATPDHRDEDPNWTGQQPR